jgi:hypothetical protein
LIQKSAQSGHRSLIAFESAQSEQEDSFVAMHSGLSRLGLDVVSNLCWQRREEAREEVPQQRLTVVE